MIHEALKFIAEEANRYILHLDAPELDPSVDKKVKLDNIAKAQDTTGSGGGNGTGAPSDTMVLTLVNLEEDKISKSPFNYERSDDRLAYKNPKVHLILYCLFSANFSSYENALKYLSYLIQFFQHKNHFTHTNSPKLPARLDKLIFDLYSMNFEQVNHLWGTLGGKYLPSALYKVRLVTIEDETPEMAGEAITKISVSGKSLVN